MTYVVVILRQYLAKQLVFGVVDGFNDIFVIAREVKEATAFARGTQF